MGDEPEAVERHDVESKRGSREITHRSHISLKNFKNETPAAHVPFLRLGLSFPALDAGPSVLLLRCLQPLSSDAAAVGSLDVLVTPFNCSHPLPPPRPHPLWVLRALP